MCEPRPSQYASQELSVLSLLERIPMLKKGESTEETIAVTSDDDFAEAISCKCSR